MSGKARPTQDQLHGFIVHCNLIGEDECFMFEKVKLTYEEMTHLLIPGAVEVVVKACCFGYIRPEKHWMRWYFDKTVTIVKIQAVEREPAFFLGIDAKGRIYPLMEAWVNSAMDNDGAGIPQEIIQHALKKCGSNQYWTIPAGAKVTDLVYDVADPKVKISFKQKRGSHMCYVASLATTTAVYAVLVGAPQRRPLAKAAWSMFHEGMDLGCPTDLKRKVFQKAKKILQPTGYVIQTLRGFVFSETPDDRLIVAEVQGENNYPHCIGLLRDWILDPTEPWALKKTRENLDLICTKGKYGKISGSGKFLRLKWAVEIVEATRATVEDNKEMVDAVRPKKKNKVMVDAAQPARTAKAGQWATPLPQQPELDAWVHKAVENKQLDVIIFGNEDDCRTVNNLQPAAPSYLELLADYSSDDGGDC